MELNVRFRNGYSRLIKGICCFEYDGNGLKVHHFETVGDMTKETKETIGIDLIDNVLMVNPAETEQGTSKTPTANFAKESFQRR